MASPLTEHVRTLAERIDQLEARIAELLLELRAQRPLPEPKNLEELEQRLVDEATPAIVVGSFVAVKLSVGGVWTGKVVELAGDQAVVDLGKAGHHRGPRAALMLVPEGWG
jgi:hypothetical protein